MKHTNPYKKNDRVTLTVTDTNNLGCGIARLDNIVTFVAGGCVGDVMEAKIIKVASGYMVARPEKRLQSSPHRTEPDCRAFAGSQSSGSGRRCGGCVFRHITYEHELALKRGFVEGAMRRAGVKLPVGEVLSTGITEGYRNKALYPIGRDKNGRTVIGFYAERTHEIIPCTPDDGADGCRLQPPVFGQIVEFTRKWIDASGLAVYDEADQSGIFRHLYLRRAETTGQIMVCLVTARPADLKPWADELSCRFADAVSIWENRNPENTNVVLGREFTLLAGREKIVDSLCGREFELSPESFYQVNRQAAELLYRTGGALADIQPGERVLDLFCGIGTIGMCICEPETELYGVEIVESAVINARANARRNGFERAHFHCCDAADPKAIETVIGRIAAQGLDRIILDPPRKGCSPELLTMLAEKAPDAKILYISCNPDTLARDLALLETLGYRAGTVQPVDLFPRTGHVETVCLLSKLNAKQHIEINLDMDELDLTDAEKKATYQEIKDYVLEHSGLKVSSLYIAQVKQKCGIIERENYNQPKSEDAKQPQCPPDKEKAIKGALKHFGMI